MNEDHPSTEMEIGSGNVFADLDLENAVGLKLKSSVLGQINSIIEYRQMTEIHSSELLGMPQAKILALKAGKVAEFSLEKLLGIMIKLDRDVEITFTRAVKKGSARHFVRSEENGGRVVV